MIQPRSFFWSTVLHVALIALALLSVAPFLWLIAAAFSPEGEIFSSPLAPLQNLDRLTLENFHRLFNAAPFGRWMVNSIFLASMHTLLVVTLSSLGGFTLAKYRFRGRRTLTGIMLLTMLLPPQVLLPSMYELIVRLGWINSYAAIIIPGAVSVFGVLLFRQAMYAVPDELLDAARVDGSSELRLWWDIALPVVRPMTGAFTLLSFLSSWNSFLWPQIVLQDEVKYNLPIGLANLMGLPQYQVHYGTLMAATLLSVLPLIVLFFLLQTDFMPGFLGGAVKG